MNRSRISIVFMPTLQCNCNCEYCFENKSASTLTGDNWGLFWQKIQEFTKISKAKVLSLYWQGGEIFTMPPEEVLKGLEICRTTFNRYEITVTHKLQTNLLLYSPIWSKIIKAHFEGRLGSSIDFPNLYRKTSSLAPEEYNNKWLEKKEEAEKDGITVGIITLPNEETLKLGADRFFSFYKDEATVKTVQINLPYPGVNTYSHRQIDTHGQARGTSSATSFARRPSGENSFTHGRARGTLPCGLLDLAQLSDFLERLYDRWVESDRCIDIEPFISLEKRIEGTTNSAPCIWKYSCAESLFALGPGGEVAQCDCWVSSSKEYLFGNLADGPLENILKSEKRKPFLTRPLHMIKDEECGECRFWKICFGGCPIRSFAFSGNINKRDHYCQVYRRIFSAILNKQNKKPTEDTDIIQ